jgi:hypothetical protein
VSETEKAPATRADRELYPIDEARQLLGNISAATFFRWRNEDKIRTVKIGKRRFVPRAEITRLASGQTA